MGFCLSSYLEDGLLIHHLYFFTKAISTEGMLSCPSSSRVKLQTLTKIQNDITTALIGSWDPLDKFLRKRWQKQNVSLSYWEKAASKERRETLCQAVRHSFLLMVKNIRAEPESRRWSDIPWSQRNPWGKEAEVRDSCFKPGKVTWGRIFCRPPPPSQWLFMCLLSVSTFYYKIPA